MMITFTKSPLPHLIPYAPDAFRGEFAADFGAWLVQQAAGLASATQSVFMLIHADDGVIWGRIAQGQLLKPDASDWTPPLRPLTVQQCRLFGDLGELFIWREAEGSWRGRKLLDDSAQAKNYQLIEEKQMLVGTRVYNPAQDKTGFPPPPLLPSAFTALIDVSTGMRQIVPCAVVQLPVRLTVLHYLSEDEDGQALIKCSRLKTVG